MKHLRINPDAHVEAEINSALGIDPWMGGPDTKHIVRGEQDTLVSQIESEASPQLSGLSAAKEVLDAIRRVRAREAVHTVQSTDYVDNAPKRDRAKLRRKK